MSDMRDKVLLEYARSGHIDVGHWARRIVGTMTLREGIVIVLLYGLLKRKECTTKEVSNVIGVCPAMVCQIHNKALRKLRHPTRAEEFGKYVEAK